MSTICGTLRFFALAAALGLGAVQAHAQGTAEQREACTPDALRLCADTVPDVSRTSACMAAHRAELSPRCRAAFDARAPAAQPRTRVAGAPAPAASHRHGARVASASPAPRRHRVRMARGDRDTREARRVIGGLCSRKLIDGDTCGFMGKLLTLAE